MNQYVAFLRGINVGGRIVKMVQLKDCFERAGMQHVRTILQTGNVAFTSADPVTVLRPALEQAVSKSFGYDVKILVYSLEEVVLAVRDYPFSRSEPDFHCYIVFINSELAQQLVEQAVRLNASVEEVQLGQGIVYWRVQKGMTLKSDFAKLLTKAAYKEHNTVRNINTLEKVLSA